VFKNAAGGAALETLLLKAACRVRYQEKFVASEVGTEPTCAIWDWNGNQRNSSKRPPDGPQPLACTTGLYQVPMTWNSQRSVVGPIT